MLKYKISCPNPVSHYLDVEASFDVENSDLIELVLPAWRPGRYEGAEYVKNVRGFQVIDENGNLIVTEKAARNIWRIIPAGRKINVRYSYFAFQADAGASYIDDEVWLINFINCLIYPEGFQNGECFVNLDLPAEWESATTLEIKDGWFFSKNYYELTDRPLLAAKKIQDHSYKCNDIPFHLKVVGNPPTDLNKLIPAFKAFSDEQINTFKSCPFPKYYFLILILPFKFYHGVEHADNTVLVLGIDEGTDHQKFIDDLLGVASHELFHTWNIKKIRPKELLPYNLKEFTFFNTGFVAEGFTTYYGDLFLVRSGVWSSGRYLQEMNHFLKRHFRNPGRHYTSLTTSSENLWIDGYKPGAPYHKVSIYVKGAIVSMMLDMRIRNSSGYKHSLDDVIRAMDERIAGSGYTIENIKNLAEEFNGADLTDFFNKYLFGTTAVDEELKSLCENFGLVLITAESDNFLEHHYGCSLSIKDGNNVVEMTDINSPADEKLSVGDVILKVNERDPADFLENPETVNSLPVKIKRLGKIKEIELQKNENRYFKYQQLIFAEDMTELQRQALENWLKNKKVH